MMKLIRIKLFKEYSNLIILAIYGNIEAIWREIRRKIFNENLKRMTQKEDITLLGCSYYPIIQKIHRR